MALAGMLRRMTPLDKAIVLLLLAVVGWGLLLVGRAPRGAWVVVEQQGRTVFKAPLANDRQVWLAGPLGETLVEIRDGRVAIGASPCPHRVCIGMGGIARRGELLACVPNGLLVRIEGNAGAEEPGHDLLSR